MVRAGVRAILATDDGVEVVAKAVDGYQSVELVRAHRPQVALLDIRMPGLDGLAAAHEIAAVAPTTGVIMPSGRRGLLRHRATVVGRLPSRALESDSRLARPLRRVKTIVTTIVQLLWSQSPRRSRLCWCRGPPQSSLRRVGLRHAGSRRVGLLLRSPHRTGLPR